MLWKREEFGRGKLGHREAKWFNREEENGLEAEILIHCSVCSYKAICLLKLNVNS